MQTEDILENGTQPTISNHEVIGNILQAGIYGYFAANQNQDILTADLLSVNTYRLPSYGSFYTTLQTNFQFGLIPRTVDFTGVTMDINFVEYIAEANDSNKEQRISFLRSAGHRLSAFEHIIPEQLISSPTNDYESISSVKALTLAAQQGQNIFVITQANSNVIDTINIDPGAETDIRNSVTAGMEVTVHEQPLTLFDWSGSGYTIIDPETGAGAYRITGGTNGSETVKKGADAFKFASLLSNIFSPGSATATSLRRVSVALSFVAGLGQIFENCANRISGSEIAFIIAIYTIISIVMVLLLANVGIFAWFILATLLEIVRNFVNQVLFYLAGCRYDT